MRVPSFLLTVAAIAALLVVLSTAASRHEELVQRFESERRVSLEYSPNNSDVRTLFAHEVSESARSRPVTLSAQPPSGWIRSPSATVRAADGSEKAPATADRTLAMTIALKQRNRDKLEAAFWSVSDPKSKSYGKFWDLSHVTALVAPTSASIRVVREWVESYGGQAELTDSRDFLRVLMPVAAAQRMLKVQFEQFEHPETGLRAIRTRDVYTVPASVAPHLDFVGDVVRFPKTKRTGETARVAPETPSTFGDDPTSPYLFGTKSGASQLYFVFGPKCKDGTFADMTATAGTPLCTGKGLTISAWQVGADAKGEVGVALQTIPTDLTWCKACSSLDPDTCANYKNVAGFTDTSAVCTTIMRGVPMYVPVYPYIQTQFSDSSASAPTYKHTGQQPKQQTQVSDWTTPQLLQQLYGVPTGIRGSNPNNSMSVAEFLLQFYNPTELGQFFNYFGMDSSLANLVTLVGTNNADKPGGEAVLDIEYIMAVAPGIPTTFWSVLDYGPDPDANGNKQEGFLQWITAVASASRIPLVHSVSYSDQEFTLSRPYTDRLDSEFMKIGLRGVSLLFASGDDGATEINGDVNAPSACAKFTPNYPSSSPYVTTVGATQLSRERSLIALREPTVTGFRYNTEVGEIMCDGNKGGIITSGGGISNVYARPSYQDDAVKAYLANPNIGIPPAGSFNPNNRAYPDIAAIGHNYLVWLSQTVQSIHGTSASTPVVAAIIALLNEARLNAGMSPLGFLNPLLYQMHKEQPEAFNDVTVGVNKCIAFGRFCCDTGYPAGPGYDAVTGLGTPKYPHMLRYVLATGASTSDSQTALWVVAGLGLGLAGCAIVAIVIVFLMQFSRRRRGGGSSRGTSSLTTSAYQDAYGSINSKRDGGAP